MKHLKRIFESRRYKMLSEREFENLKTVKIPKSDFDEIMEMYENFDYSNFEMHVDNTNDDENNDYYIDFIFDHNIKQLIDNPILENLLYDYNDDDISIWVEVRKAEDDYYVVSLYNGNSYDYNYQLDQLDSLLGFLEGVFMDISEMGDDSKFIFNELYNECYDMVSEYDRVKARIDRISGKKVSLNSYLAKKIY